jgi:hypothetical protein
MEEQVSKTKIFLARLVIVLMVAFVILGIAMHGLSVPVFERIWQNLLERPSGPKAFRFVLQPIMATIAALVHGVRDARNGRDPYFWAILTNPAERGTRLHEGLIATARVILLGLCMDLIYQFIVFDTFHPAEAVIIAGLLAFLPYLLLRGPITRVARWWLGRRSANEIR